MDHLGKRYHHHRLNSYQQKLRPILTTFISICRQYQVHGDHPNNTTKSPPAPSARDMGKFGHRDHPVHHGRRGTDNKFRGQPAGIRRDRLCACGIYRNRSCSILYRDLTPRITRQGRRESKTRPYKKLQGKRRPRPQKTYITASNRPDAKEHDIMRQSL